ncbi:MULTISPECIES: sigma-54 interaction domain-containing protein [Methylobacillus]|uniref:Sigma54 specific transcriptional regulator, Fis family n=1 Tax=Methylobacillus flagellatus (strain ATCC 51484 / DSM 6875 / VKM B-1610 / KT) TaxID=265072 RepID=Q1H0A5_METFK|nr:MULTISPECIES: sigma 54-interacting transcriptional regulator [Methylobacillus]ABE50082.1 sigma54 specific transcriptional regulator, Fis family [Methylobacillus flagellatus KT]
MPLSLAQQIAKLMPDAAVIMVNRDCTIHYWSPGAERLLGFPAVDAISQAGLAGSHCESCQAAYEVTPHDRLVGHILTLQTAGGQSRVVKKYTMPLFDDHGEFNGSIAVLIAYPTLPGPGDSQPVPGKPYHGMISHNPVMQHVFTMIGRVAKTDLPVLVRGESGTGKELVARAIHEESTRKGQPFIAINCAALNPNILESELFGHVKGAFTGAIRQHVGVFEQARGGTLFLDEIAEIPLDLQAKLLRVLETGEFTPLGSERRYIADVRIITATHRALREEAKSGRFRHDLLYRLRVIPIFLPPLRERRHDIPLLAKHLLHEQAGDVLVPQLTQAAVEHLMQYDWPGNVRELRNALSYAWVMSDGAVIDMQHLPAEILGLKNTGRAASKNTATRRQLDRHEIQAAIERHHGNLSQAAHSLGISRTTLWRKLKTLD